MINIKGKILDSNHKYKKLLQESGGKILKVTVTGHNMFPATVFLDFLVNNSISTVIQSYLLILASQDGSTTTETFITPLNTLVAGEEDNIRVITLPLIAFSVPENQEGIDLNKFNIAYNKILSL